MRAHGSRLRRRGAPGAPSIGRTRRRGCRRHQPRPRPAARARAASAEAGRGRCDRTTATEPGGRASRGDARQTPCGVLGLVLYQLTLAHDIAAVAPTCHALCDAAKLALKLRPFSSEVVTLAGHTDRFLCVAAAPDGRVITGAADSPVKVWRDGACERTIRDAHDGHEAGCQPVAVLPGGARFVSGSDDGTAKLWTLDGALERTFEADSVHRALRRGAARRRALGRHGRPRLASGGGPAVPRRRDARPHLRGGTPPRCTPARWR